MASIFQKTPENREYQSPVNGIVLMARTPILNSNTLDNTLCSKIRSNGFNTTE